LVEHLFDTRVVELESFQFTNPLVVGGFIGPGYVGVATAGYIIEQLEMHQVAHIKSPHIPPVAVFVGAKLRHPFRIYRDKAGKLCVVVCEVPVELDGLYEISSVLLDWFQKIRAREIIVLDGIPVRGIPEDRQTVCVADQAKFNQLKAHGVSMAQMALIGGVGGGILNETLTRKMTGLSLLTQISVDLPDPGATLALVTLLDEIYGLNIGTEDLEKSVNQMNQDLKVLEEQYKKLQERTAPGERHQLYG
jgi:uncharacterized protein